MLRRCKNIGPETVADEADFRRIRKLGQRLGIFVDEASYLALPIPVTRKDSIEKYGNFSMTTWVSLA
jgi:hypothetical protein